MLFIANSLNGEYLTNILEQVTYKKSDIESVYAAIAYGSIGNSNHHCLITNCIQNSLRLNIWMRYDETVPVSIPMLEFLLKSHQNNIFCKFIPDYLHSKIIWWKGFGVYIGSHNLTERAWLQNIEAGIFLSEKEIYDNKMDIELENFFQKLKDNQHTISLSKEYIDDMKILSEKKIRYEKEQKNLRKIPEQNGVSFISKSKSIDSQLASFREDYNKAITEIRSIANQLKEYRPIWVRQDIPDEWHADQFLHAFYYNKVREKDGTIPYNKFYERNKSNPREAVIEAMKWWTKTPKPPTDEDITFDKYAPKIKELLSENNILNLGETELAELIDSTHSTKDHIRKIEKSFFNITGNGVIPNDQRISIFASKLFKERNNKGQSILEIINFLLWSNEYDLCERLYRITHLKEYKIPHYSLSSFSEIIGWARPELSPPRNGRTSKALRALGYDVREYT